MKKFHFDFGINWKMFGLGIVVLFSDPEVGTGIAVLVGPVSIAFGLKKC